MQKTDPEKGSRRFCAVRSCAVRSRAVTAVLFVLIAAAVFFTSFYSVFYPLDKMISDPLFYPSPLSRSDAGKIKIIALDERTAAEYGDIGGWSRELCASLVRTLTSDQEHSPAVIAFDIMFIDEKDPGGDSDFAAACAEAGSVVTAVNAKKRPGVTLSDHGTLIVDEENVELVEYPYPALRSAADHGFANTLSDTDGYIRFAQTRVVFDGEEVPSLPLAVYRKYCERTGTPVSAPDTFGSGRFAFDYFGKSGFFEAVSLCDVLSGAVDPRAFSGCIVYVGAYAPGMQDAYNVPVDKGVQMYGVEIQANITASLLEGKSAVPAPGALCAAVSALIAALYFLLGEKIRLLPYAAVGAGLTASDLAVGVLLFHRGLLAGLITLPLFLILIFLGRLISGYLLETLKRRRILNAFRKYVAPQVVDEISRKGDYQIVLKGENREIAVLFVDIRGFTPMSESLMPEQVVEILNDYLALTTRAIFANGGTLDKFIGDATMAVFNAPFDLEDHVYKAVCTARDIAAGSEELKNRIYERFGKTVSFGIGVNCGPAVVGNIGCEFRMDYTAIGDTVNTAARLESNAAPGQILISDRVKELLDDRIKTTPVGEIPLKGKSKGVFVYQLDEVR